MKVATCSIILLFAFCILHQTKAWYDETDSIEDDYGEDDNYDDLSLEDTWPRHQNRGRRPCTRSRQRNGRYKRMNCDDDGWEMSDKDKKNQKNQARMNRVTDCRPSVDDDRVMKCMARCYEPFHFPTGKDCGEGRFCCMVQSFPHELLVKNHVCPTCKTDDQALKHTSDKRPADPKTGIVGAGFSDAYKNTVFGGGKSGEVLWQKLVDGRSRMLDFKPTWTCTFDKGKWTGVTYVGECKGVAEDAVGNGKHPVPLRHLNSQRQQCKPGSG